MKEFYAYYENNEEADADRSTSTASVQTSGSDKNQHLYRNRLTHVKDFNDI